MKQIVRRVIDRKGRVKLLELPEPHLGEDQVLVQNHFSLISSGTEMSTLAKTPPELVKQTLSDPWMRHVVAQTIFTTGLSQTAGRVWQEMIMPREIGYSGAGRVLAVGSNVEGFEVGQPVAYAANGHAEVVAPSINHVVPVPEDVDLRHAAFVTVGGIAMQSLRRAEIQFGETVLVYGLGLVGQLCAMIAKAAGCVVIGVDLSEERLEIARRNGVDLAINPATSDLDRLVMEATGKHGADATIICASSKSAEVINSSMELTRRQGRVVIVGYVKLDIHPKNFLYREIDLRYSRAYGPGSYHRGYEAGRLDYPFGYVRWTENRNLQEFIRLVANGSIAAQTLIGGVFHLDDAQDAFDAIADGSLGGIAALIDYGASAELDRRKTLPIKPRQRADGKIGVSVVGCGNHFLGKHLPSLRAHSDVEIRGLASATGKNASMIAKGIDATVITSDTSEVMNDDGTDAVLICSGHAEHREHIEQGFLAGKAMYVEKPMVTTIADFKQVCALQAEHGTLFTLGLNRRYSPAISHVRRLLDRPVYSVHYLVNQPFIPPDHWTLDEVDGAGRLVCEGEHFVDLCHLLVGAEPLSVHAQALGEPPEDLRKLANFTLTLHYERAQATVTFVESDAKDFPREQLTVQAPGLVVVAEDFAKVTVFDGKKKRSVTKTKHSMGHKEGLYEFIKAVRGEDNSMLGWDEAFRATLTMFAAQESMRRGLPVNLREFAEEVLGNEAHDVAREIVEHGAESTKATQGMPAP